MKKKNLLIGMCGSVAVSLYRKIIKEFSKHYNVKVIVTSSAEKLQIFCLSGNGSVQMYDYALDIEDFYDDNREYEAYRLKDSKVLHVELAKWADKFVICPATANTIAKINYGIADNMLTSCVLVWNKPLFIVPCMNTAMWMNKVTQGNVNSLEARGHKFIDPTVKKLACGDFGIGAMADISTIVNIVNGHEWYSPMYEMIAPPYLHPGSFAAVRKHDIHQGVDLYNDEGTVVRAVESGVIVSMGPFTGKEVGSNWWQDTSYMMVEGKSGVICYGEIEICKEHKVGSKLKVGDEIGHVVAVLPKSKIRPDIPFHKNSMLHIELYKKGTKYEDTKSWAVGDKKPSYLLDPTPYLRVVCQSVYNRFSSTTHD